MSPFRNIFRCFHFLGGYWNFSWPRLDSLKAGIMFAESGVANERMTTPFKKKRFFSCLFCPVGWMRNTEPMPALTRLEILRAVVLNTNLNIDIYSDFEKKIDN